MIHRVMNITNDDQKTLQKGFYTHGAFIKTFLKYA